MHLDQEHRHRRKRMIKRGHYVRLHSQQGNAPPQRGVRNSDSSHPAQVQLYCGNGTVLSKGVDPTSAMETADAMLVHSSIIIHSQPAYIRRPRGHSYGRIRMLNSGIGMDCTLAHCLN